MIMKASMVDQTATTIDYKWLKPHSDRWEVAVNVCISLCSVDSC